MGVLHRLHADNDQFFIDVYLGQFCRALQSIPEMPVNFGRLVIVAFFRPHVIIERLVRNNILFRQGESLVHDIGDFVFDRFINGSGNALENELILDTFLYVVLPVIDQALQVLCQWRC